MAQPKNPPISIRIPPLTLAAVDAYAKANNLTRHGAIVRLLVKGTGGWTGLETVHKLQSQPKPAEPRREPFKTRLKGEWKAP